MNKISELKQTLHAIQTCTQPVTGHTDPLSINDCWATVNEIITELEKSDDLLLSRAEQFEKEQQAVCEIPDRLYPNEDKATLTGVKRIVDLIRRHQRNENLPVKPHNYMQSAFKFKNGTYFLVTTRNGKIESYITDERFTAYGEPYAQAPLEGKTPAEYHADIRKLHSPDELVEKYSAKL